MYEQVLSSNILYKYPTIYICVHMRIAVSGMTNAARGKRGSGAHKWVAGVAMTGAAARGNIGGETCAGTDGKLMLRTATCQRESQYTS